MSYARGTKKRGGVYGTNGVLLTGITGYPKYGLRIGLYNSNNKTFEVDFVGHSWFVKREYLNWMFEKPYKNKYKYVGEDMCLSYSCLEHGVKTYVPLHPKEIISLWGSIPNAIKLKLDSNSAVSSSSDNCLAMAKVLSEMHNDGWKFLIERDPVYVEGTVKIFVQMSQNDLLKNNIKVLFKFMGKKPPAFIGDRKYFPSVKNLFAIIDADYIDVIKEKNVLNFKPYAFNIFFSDSYSQVKDFLEKWGFKEYENFIDGRIFLNLI